MRHSPVDSLVGGHLDHDAVLWLPGVLTRPTGADDDRPATDLAPRGIELRTACPARARGILPSQANNATTQNDLAPARALKELRRW